jgi:ribosomal-protein-alanine acetyltransferase
MTFGIRRLRGGDLRKVLAIERQAFPEDPWTLASGKGWLARSLSGGQARGAVRLAQLIRLIRLREAIHLVQLARFAGLGKPATRYYAVAEADGTIAGYGCLSAVAGGRAHVQAIAVRADREGEGIGTALLTDLIATAAARECREIFLDVRAENDRARLIYLRHGFTEVGVRRGYYQPSGADGIVMRLPIPRRTELGKAGVQ